MCNCAPCVVDGDAGGGGGGGGGGSRPCYGGWLKYGCPWYVEGCHLRQKGASDSNSNRLKYPHVNVNVNINILYIQPSFKRVVFCVQ